MKHNVLIIDCDIATCKEITYNLSSETVSAYYALSITEGLKALSQKRYEAVFHLVNRQEEGAEQMKIPIDEIKVRDGRREGNVDHAHELSESIRELGLLNSITVDKDFFLIAGLHRLEAVKLLNWSEVECTVCSLEGLQAELAESGENFVRNDSSTLEYGEMLLRHKGIYELLHPETCQGMRNGQTSKNDILPLLETKSFSQNTATSHCRRKHR